MSKYKYGICKWCMPSDDIYENIEILHQLGLDTMELDIQYDKNNKFLSKEYCDKVLKKANEYGITFNSTALNSIGSFEPYTNNKIKELDEFLDIALNVAINMGLKILQVPAFFESSIESDEIFEKAVLLYQKICDKIAPYGLTLGSENSLDTKQNLELIKRINRDNFAVYFDTQNPLVFKGYNVQDMLKSLDGKICEIHVKDGKTQPGENLLGQGLANFAMSADIIKNSHYQGFIVLETSYNAMSNDKNERIELIKQDIKTMKEAFEF